MKFPKMAALAASAVVGLWAAGPAHAVTFADFDASSSFNNLQWTNAGTGGTLSATGGAGNSANVYFSFLTPALASLSHLQATLVFDGVSAAGNPAMNLGGFLVQPGLKGSFSFTYAGATDLVVDGHTYHPGANLLSGTFSGGVISGQDHATAGGVNDATSSGGVLNMTSDFLTFMATGDRAYSLSMTSIADPLHASAGAALDDFGAVATGSFQADLGGGGGQGGVPEPASWALMILGFAGVGFALRRARPAYA